MKKHSGNVLHFGWPLAVAAAAAFVVYSVKDNPGVESQPQPVPAETAKLAYDCSKYEAEIPRNAGKRILRDSNLVSGDGLYSTPEDGKDMLVDSFGIDVRTGARTDAFIDRGPGSHLDVEPNLTPRNPALFELAPGVKVSLHVSEKPHVGMIASALVCQQQ